MYAGFHKAVAPVEAFIAWVDLPPYEPRNEMVFNVPLDHLVWTEDMAKLLTAADARVTQLNRPARKQLWITGQRAPGKKGNRSPRLAGARAGGTAVAQLDGRLS